VSISALIRKGITHFPLLLLVLLVLILLSVLHFQYYSGLFMLIFAILGVLVYILLTSRRFSVLSGGDQNNGNVSSPHFGTSLPGSFYLFTSAFFILFSLSLLTIVNEAYSKNIGYYILIAVCSGILIIEIFSYQTDKQGYLVLVQVLFLAGNILFINHLIFPHGIALPDAGLHFPTFVNEILTTGHVSQNTIGYYNYFAGTHIFAAFGILLMQCDPYQIYLCLGSFLVAIGVVFVFIIGKKYVSFRYGLLAAVLFTCLDYYLMYGEHPEHQAYNFGFALICFTFLLYTYTAQKKAFYLLFFISAIAVVFAHHLTAVMVFVAAGSLAVIDFFNLVQTKKFTFPSKYILLIFGVTLFTGLNLALNNDAIVYIITLAKPYATSMYSLVSNSFSLPVSTPVSSSVSGVPTSVSGVSASVSGVSGAVVMPTPTPTPIPTQVTVPPTAYDQLPFIELFENTLGSALLVFVSVMGVCYFLKKRSWFGNFVILTSVFLSCLLGLGILFAYVVILPDRLYPFLQILGLVFLGAMGLLWLFGSIPSKHKYTGIAIICLLVTLMSLFSLASIINGFETSLFSGNTLAYDKLYTTGQDVAFDNWHTSFLTGKNTNIVQVSINASGVILSPKKSRDTLQVLDRSLLKTGILINGDKFGQHSFIRFTDGQVIVPDTYSVYYDNGLICAMK